MYQGQDFVEVLKKIGYPEAETLEGSSFDYMFEDQDCLPILNCFCSTIGERNFLTPEELAELATLPPDDTFEESDNVLKHLIAKSVLPDEKDEQEIKDEIAFLKSELDGVEKQKELLRVQIRKLSLQKVKLTRETEKIETSLVYERKMLRKLEDELLYVKQKFAADTKQLLTVIQHARGVITGAPGFDLPIPSNKFFQFNLKPYMKVERNVLQYAKSFVSTPLKEKRMSCDSEDGLHESTMTSNPEDKIFQELALQLQYLRVSKEKHLKLSYEEKKVETSIKFYKEKFNIDRYHQAAPLLRVYLEEAQKACERLEKEEKQLLLLVPEAVQEYIATLHKRISIVYVKGKLDEHASLVEKQKKPLKMLVDQEIRLCALQMLMHDEKKEMKIFNEVMLNAVSKLKSVIQHLQEQESEKNDVLEGACASDETCISEGSVLSSLQKFLDVDFYLSPDDLLEEARKLFNRDCELNEKLETTFDEQMRNMKNAEICAAYFDELLYKRNWSSAAHPESVLQTAITDMNKAHMKVQGLEALIVKEMTDHQKKVKIIQNNIVMKASRDFFIFALTDPLRLQRAIQELKFLTENRNFRRTDN